MTFTMDLYVTTLQPNNTCSCLFWCTSVGIDLWCVLCIDSWRSALASRPCVGTQSHKTHPKGTHHPSTPPHPQRPHHHHPTPLHPMLVRVKGYSWMAIPRGWSCRVLGCSSFYLFYADQPVFSLNQPLGLSCAWIKSTRNLNSISIGSLKQKVKVYPCVIFHDGRYQ